MPSLRSFRFGEEVVNTQKVKHQEISRTETLHCDPEDTLVLGEVGGKNLIATACLNKVYRVETEENFLGMAVLMFIDDG